MMDPDPFGESNPFCGGEAKKAAAAPEATPAAANGAHSDEQTVDKHDDPLSFMEDDPFADPATVPRRAPAAAAAAASEQVSAGADPLSMSPAAAALASSARSAVAGVADAAKTTAASAVQAATDAAAGLTASAVPPKYVDQDQTFEQWKASAQELGPQLERASLTDKRDLAVEYARVHNVKVDPKDASAAGETQQGLAKLCRLLRISTNGLPYRCCSRVEIEGATRNKGRGLEFPFWTYTFKVYTILDEFKGQPHHDGQGEGDFNVLGNVVMLRVTRRYRDFEWLRKCLLMENPGVVVPPIPEKTLQSIKEKMGKKDGEFRGKDLEGGDNDMGEWQNDADAKRCKGCDTQFSMLVRKHHCRHCLMIFCSTCCPKPTGGKRFCADCASLKGLSEMLMKNPDVGFRMKELQLFLQEAINGPLADSETLQFFLEAPPALLADRKESTMKRIEQNQTVPRSISEAAKEKLQHVSSYITTGKQAPPSEIFTGLTPRGQERLQLATRLSQMEDCFKVFRDNLAHQLFEGLSRKRQQLPELSGVLAADADLRVLRVATEHAEKALGDFSQESKEMLFALVARFNFVIGVIQSMLQNLTDVERANKQKKSAVNDHAKLQVLNDHLDEMEIANITEMRWLNRFVAAAFKKSMYQMWSYESHRGPNDFDWSTLQKIVVALKEPF